jgi:hypothetical protein
MLLKARERAVSELGGLTVELYRRGGFRDDLLAERCSVIVGIDARLAEIEELLHVRRNVPRCRSFEASSEAASIGSASGSET